MARRANRTNRTRRSARLKPVHLSAAQSRAPALIVAATPEGLIEGIYTWCNSQSGKPGQPEITLSISTIERTNGESWLAAWLTPEAGLTATDNGG